MEVLCKSVIFSIFVSYQFCNVPLKSDCQMFCCWNINSDEAKKLFKKYYVVVLWWHNVNKMCYTKQITRPFPTNWHIVYTNTFKKPFFLRFKFNSWLKCMFVQLIYVYYLFIDFLLNVKATFLIKLQSFKSLNF